MSERSDILYIEISYGSAEQFDNKIGNTPDGCVLLVLFFFFRV